MLEIPFYDMYWPRLAVPIIYHFELFKNTKKIAKNPILIQIKNCMKPVENIQSYVINCRY